MLGTVGICNHKIRCLIGCNPEEKIVEQEIFLDLKLKCEFSSCILSDDVNDTVNYVEIAALCTSMAQRKKYALLESLAHDILNEVLLNQNVEWASVAIKKPEALSSADYAWIELERYK